jgi:hypothetical protein
MPRPIEIESGAMYGRLTVKRRNGTGRGGRRYLCRCECGRYKTATASHLKQGGTRSCGCGVRKRAPVPLGPTTALKRTLAGLKGMADKLSGIGLIADALGLRQAVRDIHDAFVRRAA